MASRFTHSTLHQRDPRSSSSLFDSYNGGSSRSPAQVSSRSPSRPGGYAQGYSNGHIGGVGGDGSTYRTATPNSKGQYSDAVLSSLESQNDSEIAGITAKITVAIGEEIRESSSLAEKMNDAFDSSRVKLRACSTVRVELDPIEQVNTNYIARLLSLMLDTSFLIGELYWI
ncbi:protein transport protein bet1 [Microsporum audouinii]